MTIRLALAGAGLIGRRHITAIRDAAGTELVGIADPSEPARDFAEAESTPHFATLPQMLEAAQPDGVIVATPNTLHLDNALACIAADVPALIEKPLAGDLKDAARIVEAGKAAGIPLLTGHHRRHNPLIAKAKEIIADGELGQIAAIQATTWLRKPDDYFDMDWRTQPGAGPILINLSHDIDLLRHLCGEITQVHAMAANAARGHAVEDTAALLLSFANGALGTMTLSDAIAAPWSWELTAHENPAYPGTSEACYLIGGTSASLSIPDLALWSHATDRGWWSPISAMRRPVAHADPFVAQIEQFAAVIRDGAAPLVSAEEGLRTMRVIDAIQRAVATGQTAAIDDAK